MKKFGLFLVGLMAAQFAFSQHVQFGLKGGANISGVSDNTVPDASSSTRVGFHVGGLAHIHVSRSWAVQPEVVFSKEGAELNYGSIKGKTDLNYINIPVLVQYMTGGGFRLETGPQVGLLTAAHFKDQSGAESVLNNMSKAKLDWAFGLGYITSSGFGIDGRFNLGLTNLYKEGTPAVAKGRVGQIGIFYQFR